MQSKRFVILILCCVISVNFVKAQMYDRDSARKKYEAYKARVVVGDLNIDWRDFRLAAALGIVGPGFYWHDEHEQFTADLDAGKYEKALDEAQALISRNFASIEGHLLCMTVLQKMSKNDEAKKQEAILNAIAQSIMNSGDGKSAETAWFTVLPSETVLFMTNALGGQIDAQELVHVNGHAYDKLTVKNRVGKKLVVWFNSDTNEELKRRAQKDGVYTQN